MHHFLKRMMCDFRLDTSGLAVTELALVAPLLMVLTLGTVDYSLLALARMTVDGAARAGAAYAVAHGYDQTAISNRITTTASRSSIISVITANPAPTQWFGCPNVTTGVSAAASAATVCSSGLKAGTYVTATAQATYNFLLPWPDFPSAMAIQSSSTVRIG